MGLQLVQVNVKARDDARLGQFWADVLGWSVASEAPGVTNLEPIGYTWPHPSAVCVDVVSVPDPESVNYRAHLDLATTSPEHHSELTARLTELGALRVPIVGAGEAKPGIAPANDASETSWTAWADPEGNLFRVLDPAPTLDGQAETGPISAVVVHCHDARAQARFWGTATGWVVHEESEERVCLRAREGVGPFLVFDGAPVLPVFCGRVHLDLLPVSDGGDPAEQVVEVERLRSLGATDVDLGQGDAPWVCLADPEGNDFCVLAPR